MADKFEIGQKVMVIDPKLYTSAEDAYNYELTESIVEISGFTGFSSIYDYKIKGNAQSIRSMRQSTSIDWVVRKSQIVPLSKLGELLYG